VGVRVDRRRGLKIGGVGALALLLGACASPAVQVLTRRSVSWSREQLQQAFDQRFPFEVQPNAWVQVRLSSPRVRLLGQAGRLAAQVQCDVRERLLNTRHPAQLELDFGLRYQASDRSIRMQDVRVRQATLLELPPAVRELVSRQSALWLQPRLEGQSLYQIKPGDLSFVAALGLEPKGFRWTDQTLTLDFDRPGAR
jgi:hypothetical protein